MAEVNVEKPYKDEELENISKKDILQFLQENSSVKVNFAFFPKNTAY